MGRLNLALLGPPEVQHHGHVLTFRTRKTLALLAYLAVEAGMHSREKLTALLWPESDESQGRAMLRNTLLYLRQALDGDEPSHLIVERNAIGLDSTHDLDLDLQTLEMVWKAARIARTGLMSAAPAPAVGEERGKLLAQLQRATRLYRGGFMEGLFLDDSPNFEGWVRLQREMWRQRISTVFDHLSQIQAEGGQLAGAVETATRWVAFDALDENAHRRLMQAYLEAGDRKAALQVYETCRARLAEELHTRPAPETLALAERIRAATQKAHWPHAQGAGKPAHNRGSTLPEVPLVGRANEYSTLIEVYHAVVGEQTRLVLIKGEAGIGKTRLASEFLAWAAAQRADILQGRAFETGGRLPYQPLVEALRGRIEKENAPDDLLSDVWLAELSRLLPELRERYPDLPEPTADETTARIRLFEAVVRLGEALTRQAPVVLFIDDVQWTDAASLDVLHYAGRRWSESSAPVLPLLSLRTEALLTAGALSRWLSGLEHDLHATTLTLNSLTLDDTLQLISALGEQETDAGKLEGFGRWLFSETRGQPFYVTETLKALLERKLLGLHPVEAYPSSRPAGIAGSTRKWIVDFAAVTGNEARLQGLLPSSVREVIRSRLSQLTPTAFTLLTAGAVLGHDFTFERLCRVAHVAEHEGLPALDELLAVRLLYQVKEEERVTSRTSSETYLFTHDKIRDVAYTEAGETRRRILHSSALEVLQREGSHRDRPPAAELAHHALAAGLAEPAFHFSVVAGDKAMQIFAVRDAIAQYEQARRIMTGPDAEQSTPITAIQHLYLQLGRAYELNTEFERANSTYEAMLAFARTSNAPAMECTALNHLATLITLTLQNPGDLGRAEAFLHEALQVAESLGEGVELAETEWSLAQVSLYRFDAQEVLARGGHALALARRLGLQELTARSLNVMTYALMASRRWQEAEGYAGEARTLFSALGNRAMETDCLCLMATAQINCGRPREGIDTARTAHAISLEIENAWGQVNSAIPLAQGLLEIGAYSEALAYAEQAAGLTRATDMFILLGSVLTTLGSVYRAILAMDAALTIHMEGIRKVEPSGLKPFIEMLATELCTDYALTGAWEEAYTCARQAAMASESNVFLFSTLLTFWHRTEALVRADDVERATEDVQRFGERIGKSQRYRIPYLRAVAILAQYGGEIDKAIRHLQEAVRLAEEIGLPGELWQILAVLGELQMRQNDESKARHAFTHAAELVQTLTQQMEDTQLRMAFLSAEPTRYVLEQATTRP